jgi:hypothetical protein
MRQSLFILSLVILVVASCTKDKGEIESKAINTDAKLFAFYQSQTFSYYKGDNVNKIASMSGEHIGTYFLKFNAKATSALGPDGKLAAGSSFPDSSLVVKEMYNGGATPYMYIMLMKNSKSPLAKNGWLWAKYNPDGTNIYSIGQDASTCISCHAPGGRDYLQSFDYHP